MPLLLIIYLDRTGEITLVVNKCSNKQYLHALRGFSLLEISLALVLFGFVLLTLSKFTNDIKDFNRVQDNKVYLNEIREAVITYVQVNGYLPCPDSDLDGDEDRVTGSVECTNDNGAVPYLDLGFSPTDEWFSNLYYAVNKEVEVNADMTDNTHSASYFHNDTTSTFNLNTPPIGGNNGDGNIVICGPETAVCNDTTAADAIIEPAAVAVIVSFGENGTETWAARASGDVVNLSAVEQENIDLDNNTENVYYFWNSPSASDDQMTWITGYDVKHAILKTGSQL